MGESARFRAPVRSAMTSRLETIAPEEGIDRVYDILNRGLVALVLDGGNFLGLITRADLLSYLRRRLQ